MSLTDRSGCPISLALEVVGDRWSLLVLRDIVFAGRVHFRELLRDSEEGISSSVLADRLTRLVEHGVLTRTADGSHRQKAAYRLTRTGLDLVPVLITLGLWGAEHRPADQELAAAAQELTYETPPSWQALMDALREEGHAAGEPVAGPG